MHLNITLEGAKRIESFTQTRLTNRSKENLTNGQLLFTEETRLLSTQTPPTVDNSWFKLKYRSCRSIVSCVNSKLRQKNQEATENL